MFLKLTTKDANTVIVNSALISALFRSAINGVDMTTIAMADGAEPLFVKEPLDALADLLMAQTVKARK